MTGVIPDRGSSASSPACPPNSCRTPLRVRAPGRSRSSHSSVDRRRALGTPHPAGRSDRYPASRTPVVTVTSWSWTPRVSPAAVITFDWFRNFRIAEPGLGRGRTARRRTDLSSPPANRLRILRRTAVPPCPELPTSAAHATADEERRHRCLNPTAPFSALRRAAMTPPRIPAPARVACRRDRPGGPRAGRVSRCVGRFGARCATSPDRRWVSAGAEVELDPGLD
jgi:hypothetical protein